MKNLKPKYNMGRLSTTSTNKLLVFVLFFLCFTCFSVMAQTVPEPPKPPKSTVKKSYSICVDDHDNNKRNSSVSVSVSDHSYKFRANFHSSKNDSVKALILSKIGDKGLKNYGNTYIWTNTNSDTDFYEVKLSKGYLRMYVDTETSSNAFVTNINNLGDALKVYISGKDKEKSDTYQKEKAKEQMAKAKRDLERAKRDLERAQRELKRAEAEAKRLAKNN